MLLLAWLLTDARLCLRIALLTRRYTVRVADWRYTEWVRFDNTTGVADWLTVVGQELYPEALGKSCRFDTDSVNVAADPANAGTIRKLAAMLRTIV